MVTACGAIITKEELEMAEQRTQKSKPDGPRQAQPRAATVRNERAEIAGRYRDKKRSLVSCDAPKVLDRLTVRRERCPCLAVLGRRR